MITHVNLGLKTKEVLAFVDNCVSLLVGEISSRLLSFLWIICLSSYCNKFFEIKLLLYAGSFRIDNFSNVLRLMMVTIPFCCATMNMP